MEEELKGWLATFYLPQRAKQLIIQWLANTGLTITQLFKMSKLELKAHGLPVIDAHVLMQKHAAVISDALRWIEEDNQSIICWSSPDYPPLLKTVHQAPLFLFVAGNKNALLQTQMALVGARNPSVTGLKNAEAFAFYLSKAGLAITSGLAHGIDAASHRGALLASGVTLGVAGTGLANTYPPNHHGLVNDILSNQGAIISEFPLRTPPLAANFPRRNRIIAGLSVGVLVVEAAVKSGSLITARYALEQGREVFAIPGSIHHPLARGCHHLIRQGAKLVETASDILEEIRTFSPFINETPVKTTTCVNLDPKIAQVLHQIEYEITPMDVILLRSGLSPGEISSTLLSLELNGYIQTVPGGYVRISTNHLGGS